MSQDQPHSEKSRARENTVQFLYQCELDKIHYFSIGDFEQFVANFSIKTDVQEYMRTLCEGVFQRRSEVDDLIKKHARNWNFDRITKTDLCVLRVAIFEIISESVPRKVAINEGIELAKRFGAKDSGRFVNGILDKVLATGPET